MAFVETWDETKPAGTRDLSLGDDDIREFKRAIRERLAFGGMYFPSTDDSSAGEFNYIRFREQSSNPTAVADKFFLFTKTASSKANLFFEDEDGNVMQCTDGGSWIAGMTKEVKMWFGTVATIPTGWQLANGTNGTPDLRDKFIVGAKQDDSGAAKTNVSGSLTQSGGAATVTLAEANLPPHTHTGPSHTHGITIDFDNSVSTGNVTLGGGASNNDTVSETTDAGGTGNTGSTGSGTAFSILPPYYALCFIARPQ